MKTIIVLSFFLTIGFISCKTSENKTASIERKNVVFKDKTWKQNRTKLLSWVDKNHSELNGFIYNQTETGGMKFLKTIAFYKNRK